MFLSGAIDGIFHQTFGRRQLGRHTDVAVTNNDELVTCGWQTSQLHMQFTLDGRKVDTDGRKVESSTLYIHRSKRLYLSEW